jgi:starch phosphorylase
MSERRSFGMKTLGKISIFPKLPEPIKRLHDLAYNLWWVWNPDAQALFSSLDPDLWKSVNQNPVKFLRNVKQNQLNSAAQNQTYMAQYGRVLADFDAYMAPTADTWFRQQHGDEGDLTIAYFSAEFGLHEALPIYSGGLGILSGDHCKEASDLGLPLVGVGFLYPQGYFTQHISGSGEQEANYEKIDFSEVPAQPALDANGNPVMIHVDLPGRTVYAQIWRIQVGRIPLYLMDTDVERNAHQDRELSARLYGGDNEMRISQEFVLGIGGVRALRALGYAPTVWHMNEGHSAFLNLERIRELVQSHGLNFDEAVEFVRAGSVFTTHTPVAAGHDAFNYELVEKFFWQYWGRLGIDRQQFLELASHDQGWGPQFSMTVLAFRLSAYHNGVSELHGHVSRRMWAELWPGTPVEQTPIGHITNGVHTGTWLVPELRDLYSQYLPQRWLEHVDDPQTWQSVDQIPDDELWRVHLKRKNELIDFIRERIRKQYLRHGEGPRRMAASAGLLDPEALTIGFARRFATYKRATLIFHDLERLKRILNNPERPVQIIFSGKAHPRDEPGRALIQRIHEVSQDPEFWGKIVFLENYDMNIARHLISGVDIWLNNPRRPYEASGTSGQKAALSGAPNFSVLDGWWREAYNGNNGWAIGEERDYKNQETQDEADVLSLYATLEDEIVPLYYERDSDGVPHGWVERMKASIKTCAPLFSMKRMVKEYTERYYIRAMASAAQYAINDYAIARQIAEWKRRVRQNWSTVNLQVKQFAPLQATVGEPLKMVIQVWPGALNEDEIVAEIVVGQQNEFNILENPQTIPMQKGQRMDGGIEYSGALTAEDSGQLTIGLRVRPTRPEIINPYELGLSRWA